MVRGGVAVAWLVVVDAGGAVAEMDMLRPASPPIPCDAYGRFERW
jgi:hypothetical protein